MISFRLSYLFYVGIILPTVVTLALFVFFVICYRKQSARKAVLTKPYDPHGTMRRLGIPNRPPPPPLFLSTRRQGLITPTSEDGGEDNAAYDMSRSPSAEANAAGKTGGNNRSFHPSPLVVAELESSVRQLQMGSSPSGEIDFVGGRLAFHGRYDSGVSEPVYESPGACSHGAGGGGGAGGVAAAGSAAPRPQSQASHSSHSTDSEDSGFRSARSGQVNHQGHHEPPSSSSSSSSSQVLRRSRSAGRGKGRGYYHRAATSSPDSDTEPSLPLTPTTLWAHLNHHHHHHHLHQHSAVESGEDSAGKRGAGSDNEEDGLPGWTHLQDLSSPLGTQQQQLQQQLPGERGVNGVGVGVVGQEMTCHHQTLAQVHSSHTRELQPDMVGFSVV